MGERPGRVRLRGGYMEGDSLPQLQFRVGGPATVRGYTYGFRRGRILAAAQFDLELTTHPWVAPYVLADVGNVYQSDVPGVPGDPLAGVGAGLSFFGGWMRLELATGVNPSTAVRADFLFRVPQ